MEYKSYKSKVISALRKSKREICNELGNFITAEAQMREPVLTGNMRRSTTFDVLDGDSGINVGVTADALYAVFVEKGSSKQEANPFLEPAVMDNISTLEKISGQKLKMYMGSD